MSRTFDHRIDRVRVPVDTVNLVNAGGLPYSILIECYGASKSGKSTFCYQAAQYFFEDYKEDAVLLILDAENAVNADRLELAFGLQVYDDPRVWRRPAMTIERALDEFMKALKYVRENKKYLMVIWDSISASNSERADSDFQKSQEKDEMALRGATEPMSRAQVLKWALNRMLGEIYDEPIIIFLINQMTTKVNQFNTSLDSSGGFALRHNVNERFLFEFVKNIGGDKKESLYKTGTMSAFTIKKSRSMPSLQDIPVIIDDSLGGRIAVEQEIPLVANKLGILSMKSGGWYHINEDYMSDSMPEVAKKSLQYVDISNNAEYIAALRTAISNYFRKTFKLVDFVYSQSEEMKARAARAGTSTSKASKESSKTATKK